MIARSMFIDIGIPVSNLRIEEVTKTNLPIKHYFKKPKIEVKENDIENETVNIVRGPMSSSEAKIKKKEWMEMYIKEL